MQRWGRQLAAWLKPGDVLALVGALGAGKTTLVQGIAHAWGYKRRANSPTFSLVNEYAAVQGTIYHMDLYRMKPDELDAFPLEEYLEPGALTVIEWADRAAGRWPHETLEIRLKASGPNERRVSIPSLSPHWRKRLPPSAFH